MHLLLISNSTNPGEAYLSWPLEYIRHFFQERKVTEVLFIPYAGVNLVGESVEKSFDVYEERVKNVFATLDIDLVSVHHSTDPIQSVKESKGIVVGGGNTFHLVKMMHESGIMQAIQEKVLNGTPFAGWSAGSNVACPTMRTTNDMPISQPPSFDCLGLVPFQINPHYLDAHPQGHGGETREQRINEFLTVNRSTTVIGLREATLLEIHNQQMELKGRHPMRIFRFGNPPVEIEQGDVSEWLK